MSRPSKRELRGKIDQAKEAVSCGKVQVLSPKVIAAEALDLGYELHELSVVLSALLDLVTPEDYRGSHPPARSYERQIQNSELFAFSVNFIRFGCDIYFKFTLANGHLWLVSLHEDRPQRGS